MTSILLVEDDQAIQEAYKTVLEMEGFEVVTANDGEQALEETKKQEPEVILMDMLMPRMDGLSFLKAYDQPNKHPNVKIICFSNMSIPESKQAAMNMGAIEYLAKSTFTPREMISKIKVLVA